MCSLCGELDAGQTQPDDGIRHPADLQNDEAAVVDVMRPMLCVPLAFIICLLFGQRFINWLVRQKIGDNPNFDEATLNLDGPLGPDAARPSAPRMLIGSFPAHTAQGHALILLHELGHLVYGPGGDWLLPNDGSDYALSARNTLAVEAHCVEQLKTVRD